jgi:hypothetical protein
LADGKIGVPPDGKNAEIVLKFPMETLLIIAAVLALISVVVVIAIWTAPDAEETEEGFHIIAPSGFQRMKARWWRRRPPKNGVGRPPAQSPRRLT